MLHHHEEEDVVHHHGEEEEEEEAEAVHHHEEEAVHHHKEKKIVLAHHLPTPFHLPSISFSSFSRFSELHTPPQARFVFTDYSVIEIGTCNYSNYSCNYRDVITGPNYM